MESSTTPGTTPKKRFQREKTTQTMVMRINNMEQECLICVTMAHTFGQNSPLVNNCSHLRKR
jgi:hypothetical protein